MGKKKQRRGPDGGFLPAQTAIDDDHDHDQAGPVCVEINKPDAAANEKGKQRASSAPAPPAD